MAFAFRLHEDSTTEFASAMTDRAGRAFCAFLNGRGGTVHFGLGERGEIEGVDDADALAKEVSEFFFRRISPETSPVIESAVDEVTGRTVVSVTVSPGYGTPCRVDADGSGFRAYVRHGASSCLATDEELCMLAGGWGPVTWERQRSRRQDLSFADFHRRFPEKLPEGVGLFCWEDGGPYSNLAFLLSDQCDCQLRLAVFDGQGRASPIVARFEASGSLPAQLECVLAMAAASTRVAVSYRAGERFELREVPPAALREALVNACVHRDFSQPSDVKVSIFSDRIEIDTASPLPRSCRPEVLRQGLSVIRNEGLCEVFRTAGLMKKAGTGIPAIFDEYAADYVDPNVESLGGYVRVTLPRRAVTETGREEEKILAYIAAHDGLTRRELEEAFGPYSLYSMSLLSGLESSGHVKRTRVGRFVRYFISGGVPRKIPAGNSDSEHPLS